MEFAVCSVLLKFAGAVGGGTITVSVITKMLFDQAESPSSDNARTWNSYIEALSRPEIIVVIVPVTG